MGSSKVYYLVIFENCDIIVDLVFHVLVDTFGNLDDVSDLLLLKLNKRVKDTILHLLVK